MRPQFLQRAAQRPLRTAVRWLGLLTLVVACLLAGHAWAGPASKATRSLGESPLSMATVGDLNARWKTAKEAPDLVTLATGLNKAVAQAHAYGIETPAGMPLLLLMHADVLHRLGQANGRCAAGSVTLGQMLAIAPQSFKDVQYPRILPMLKDFKNCPDADSGFKQGLLQGQQLVAAAKFDPSKPYTVTVDDIGQTHVSQSASPQAGREALDKAIPAFVHEVEVGITKFACKMLGLEVDPTMAQLPLLNPEGPDFKRFLWWCALAAAFVMLRVAMSVLDSVLDGVAQLMKLVFKPNTPPETRRRLSADGKPNASVAEHSLPKATARKPKSSRPRSAVMKKW